MMADLQYAQLSVSACTWAPQAPQRAMLASTGWWGRESMLSPQRQGMLSARMSLTSYWM
jgi:hypothetical protein